MTKTFSDLEFDGGRVTSTPTQLLEYMVHGFVDDVMHYQATDENTARGYRDRMIQELKKGVIPSSLYTNLSFYKLGVIIPWKESTSNRVTRRKA